MGDKRMSIVGDASSTDVDEQKLSKLRDKKKKKKSAESGENEEKNIGTERAQSAVTKKKKDKTPKGESMNGRSTACSDESDSKSLKLGKKKKGKSSGRRNSVIEELPTKKKTEKALASLKSPKKKKKS